MPLKIYLRAVAWDLEGVVIKVPIGDDTIFTLRRWKLVDSTPCFGV